MMIYKPYRVTTPVARMFAQDPLVGFAQLHVRFAARVSAVLGLSRSEALRTWTPAYRLCGSRWPGDVAQRRGGSWLYNLPGYRALFPSAVLDGATFADPRDELEFLALWGQFLRGDHTLYQPAVTTFLRRLASAHDERGLSAAFPPAKLDWRAPIEQIATWLSRAAGSARPHPVGPVEPGPGQLFQV